MIQTHLSYCTSTIVLFTSENMLNVFTAYKYSIMFYLKHENEFQHPFPAAKQM